MTLSEALAAYQKGYITQTDLYNLFYQMEKAQNAGISDATISAAWQSFLGSPAMATTPSTTVPTQQATQPATPYTYGQTGTSTPSDTAAFQEFDPQAAYLKKYNIPGQGASDFQSWLGQQFQPTYATYKAQNLLSPQGTTDPGFGSYLTGDTANPFNTRKQAANLFGQASALGGQGSQSFQQALGGDFQDFIQNVLKNRYGADLAGNMGQNLGGLQKQYAAQTNGQGVDFLNFLKQQFRL